MTYTDRWQVLADLAYALDGSPDITLADALNDLANVFPYIDPGSEAAAKDFEGYAVGSFIASLRQHQRLPAEPFRDIDLDPVPALCALVLDHIERTADIVSESHRRYYNMLKAWIHSPGVLPDSPSEQHEAAEQDDRVSWCRTSDGKWMPPVPF
jgi:hypothetical protein